MGTAALRLADTVLEVWCAWCKRYITTKPGQGQSGKDWGICPECMRREMAKLDAWDEEGSNGIPQGD